MLKYFSPSTRKIELLSPDQPIDLEGIWFDLYKPLPEEIKLIEGSLGIEIPTTEEMQEIEYSSRFYQENHAFYMTLNLVAYADTNFPLSSPVTFVLTEKYLVTIRYVEPKPFLALYKRSQKNFHEGISSDILFITLLELIVDRIADIVEAIAREIEVISREIFAPQNKMDHQRALKDIFSHLGRQGDLSTKVRLSLENLNRLLSFFGAQSLSPARREHYRSHLSILGQDVLSITDHITFIFHKINFLLDATLGMINIEQNSVVKILSGAAVLFLPPTLIASIYGMNFSFMPELRVAIAYPIILIVMVLSAVLPYVYFKRKGWLH